MRLFAVCFGLFVAFGLHGSSWAENPNIVLILADDMGQGDVQALNENSKIATPHLNKLAKAGMVFTDAHTPSSVCTPTRYGLLTGRYCWRTHLKRGVLNGYSKPLIQAERETIAGFLRSTGYRTGIVGKWHLGLDFTRNENEIDFGKPVNNGPNRRGFDYSYIIPASLDFPPYVYIENEIVTDPETVEQNSKKFPGFLRKGPRSRALVMEDCLDHLAAKAIEFVERNSKTQNPFFLYVPLTAPHKPVLPHHRFRGKSGRGDYGDFVQQVDSTVGRILKSLDDNGISEETLVIYTSDNGSFMYRLDESSEKDHLTDSTIQGFFTKNHQANGKFRGTKADVWEAGHRVPFLVRWPGKISAGSYCDQTICLTDIFATCADLVNAPLNPESAPDSFSFSSILHGKEQDYHRGPVIHHSAAGMFAIRDGDWKLVLGNGSGGREQPRGKPFQKPYQLFNLANDPGEKQNVIDNHAQVAAELENKCLAIIEKDRSRQD